MTKIVILLCLLISMVALADVVKPTPAPQPNLAPVIWSAGVWHCKGRYHPLPPFVDHAYDVEAQVIFRPTAGGFWLLGEYAELHSSGGEPLTFITEVFTVDPFGNGLRTFSDSHFGQLNATLALTATGVDFTGIYTLFGTSVTFTETLVRGRNDLSFTTDSRVSGQTFHTQTCVKE